MELHSQVEALLDYPIGLSFLARLLEETQFSEYYKRRIQSPSKTSKIELSTKIVKG